jgi:hypothetical protein
LGEGDIEKNRVFKGEVGEHRTSILLFFRDGEREGERIETIEYISIL